MLKLNNANSFVPCFGAKKKKLTTDTLEISSKTSESSNEKAVKTQKKTTRKVQANAKTNEIATKSAEISKASNVISLNKAVALSVDNKAICKKIANDFAHLHELKQSLYEDAINLIKKEEGVLYAPSPNYDIKFGINSPEKEITLISSSTNQDEIKVVINSKDSKIPQKTFILDKSFKINSEEPIDSNKELEPILKKYEFIEFSKGEKERICALYKEAKETFDKLKNYDKTHYRNYNHMRRFNLSDSDDYNMFDMGFHEKEFEGMYWCLDDCLITENGKVKYHYDDRYHNGGHGNYSLLAIPKNGVWDAYYFEKDTGELVKHHLLPMYDKGWMIDFDDEDIYRPKIFYGNRNRYYTLEDNPNEQTKIIDKDDIDLVYDIAVNKDPSKLYQYITKK